MQIFYYNQSLRIFHLQEDYGSIDSPPDEMEDAGSLEEPVEYEEVENLLIVKNIDYKCVAFKFKSKAKTEHIPKEHLPHVSLNTDDIVFCGIVLTWIGFGTVFELNNGLERNVCPYLNSGVAR